MYFINSFCSILSWHSCFYTIILFLPFQNKIPRQRIIAWILPPSWRCRPGGKNDTCKMFIWFCFYYELKNYNCVLKHVLNSTFKSLFFQAEIVLFVTLVQVSNLPTTSPYSVLQVFMLYLLTSDFFWQQETRQNKVPLARYRWCISEPKATTAKISK